MADMPAGNAEKTQTAPGALGPAAASWLEITDRKGNAVRRVELDGTSMTVGRAAPAEIRIDHETISRRHAEFFCDPFNRWWVRDLGSRNGVKLNHQKVAEGVITAGDLIRLGDFHFVLHHPVRAEPAPAIEAAARTTDMRDLELSTIDHVSSGQIAAQHLVTVMDLGGRLRQIADRLERGKEICQLMVSGEFRGQVALLLNVNPTRAEQPRVWCSAHADGDKADPFYISTTLVRKVLASGAPLMASNVGKALSQVEISISPDIMKISAAACPLGSDELGRDLLYVVFPPELAQREWLALTSLVATQWMQCEATWATQRDIANHAAIESDLRRARLIQQQLVPRKVTVPGLDIAVSFEPCRWVGGDYVDVVPLADGRVFLAVADVCGKGLQAALLASSVHTMVHSSLRGPMDLANLMNGLNEYMCAYAPEGSFVTMLAVVLDCRSGKLEYVNAGHPAGMIFTPSGKVRQLSSTMPPLCVTNDPMAMQVDCLNSAEMLAIFSDGWIELPGPSGQLLELAEFDRLVQGSWAASANGAAAKFVERAAHLLSQFLKDSTAVDDRTMLAVKRT